MSVKAPIRKSSGIRGIPSDADRIQKMEQEKLEQKKLEHSRRMQRSDSEKRKVVKVSFDLDGVLYEKPSVYLPLCVALKRAGVLLGVVTGHGHGDKDKVFQQLAKMGYPDFDFYFGRRKEDLPFNGAKRKSQVIRDEGIDIHFEDYDYDWPDTVKLFAELGQEDKVIRVRSKDSGKLGKASI